MCGETNFILTYLRLKKQCLTVDTRPINDLGPGKFRKQADKNRFLL